MNKVCGCNDIVDIGLSSTHGYWGDKTVLFHNVPCYECSVCLENYININIAILLEGLTVSLLESEEVKHEDNLNVDLNGVVDVLASYAEDIHELIRRRLINFNQIDSLIIFNRDLLVNLRKEF